MLAASGYETVRRTVDLVEGQSQTIRLELVQSQAEPEPAEPTRVAVRLAPAPRKEPTPSSLPPAAHTPAWVWISGASGILLGGVAVGFALDARAQEQALEDRCGSDFVCNEDLELRSRTDEHTQKSRSGVGHRARDRRLGRHRSGGGRYRHGAAAGVQDSCRTDAQSARSDVRSANDALSNFFRDASWSVHVFPKRTMNATGRESPNEVFRDDRPSSPVWCG